MTSVPEINARPRRLLKQAGGGLLWGAFLILAPLEVLLLGAIVWLPLFIWREKVRASRHGYWPGAAVRYSIIVATVVLAGKAPLKPEDRRVGPLPRTRVTLGELADAGVVFGMFDPKHKPLSVRLNSTTPTRREVMDAITGQTGFRAHMSHCGNGATILFGCDSRLIIVTEK